MIQLTTPLFSIEFVRPGLRTGLCGRQRRVECEVPLQVDEVELEVERIDSRD